MGIFSHIIRSLDFFSAKPTWYVRGHPTSTSTSGIIFTILLIGFLIWAAVYLSSDLVNHENPRVTENLLLGVGLEYAYNIRYGQFSYVFGMMNGETQEFYFDPRIFTARGILTDNFGNNINVDLIKCQPQDVDDYYAYNGDLMCFNTTAQDLTISGLKGLMTLDFSLCENTTENGNHCLPAEERDKIFTRKDQLFVFFPIHSILTWNHAKPVIQSWNFQNFFVDNMLTKRITLVLRKILLATDDGFFTHTPSYLNITAHEQFFSDIGARVPGSIFSVEIFTNGNVNMITRNYPKVQDFLGQFMGVMHALVFVLTILVVPFVTLKMFLYLGKEAYKLTKQRKIGPKEPRFYRSQAKKLIENANKDLQKGTLPTLNIISPREDGQLNVPSPGKEKIDSDCSLVMKNSGQANSIKESIVELSVEKSETSKEIKLPYAESEISIGPEDQDKISQNEEKLGEITSGTSHTPPRDSSNSEPAGTRDNDEGDDKHRKNRGCCRRKRNRISDEDDINITYFEWLFSGIYKTPHMTFAEKLRDEICQKLDVKTVIKKFLEIDLLKNILLTRNQLILFDNVCKPSIHLDYWGLQKRKFTFEYRTEEIMKSFYGNQELVEDTYKAIKEDPHKSPIDVKLIRRYENKLSKKQTRQVSASWEDLDLF